MKRLTFTSLLLEARRLEEMGHGGVLPMQSSRGDEHLCAACAKKPGKHDDGEGRLVCDRCR